MLGILVFLCIFSYALAFKKMFRNGGFGAALFGAFCTLILFSYVFVFLLGSYTIAPYVLVCGGAVLLVYFLFFEKTTLKDVWAKNRQILIAFLVASVILSIALFNTIVWYDDEFNYWARAVKELYAFNGSYFNPFTNMRHRDYMPAYVPFQYCIVRVFGWKDAYLYHVNAAAIVTALLAAIEAIKPKRMVTIAFFLIFSVLALPLGNENLAINSLLMEVQLAVLFVCSLLFYIFSERTRQSATVSILAIGTLVLLKSFTGLLFAAVLFVTMLAMKLLVKQRISIKTLVAALLVLLAVHSSWSVFFRYHEMKVVYEAGAVRQEMFGEENLAEKPRITLRSFFSSNPRSTGISSIFTSGLPDDFYQHSQNALNMFVHQPLSSGRLTALPLTIALLAVAVALMVILRHQKLYLVSFFATISGLAAYLAGIFLTYAVQGETVSSFNRYYAVVLVSLSIYVLFGVCLLLEKNSSWLFSALVTAGLLSLLLVFFGPRYLLNSIFARTEPHYPQAQQAHDELKEYTSPEGNTLLVLGKPGQYASDTANTLHNYFFLQERTTTLLRNEPSNASALDAEWFEYHTRENLASRVIVWVETAEYRDMIAGTMGISPDEPLPWVFDVHTFESQIQYIYRGDNY